MKDWILSEEQLKDIMDKFLVDIQKGLGKKTHPTSIVKCFITYVQDLPDGTESGKFFALDLGGTNFRVLLIVLDGDRSDMKSKIFAIPQHIMVGPGEQLFDHIAECLSKFAQEEGLMKESLPLGFTFSFPLQQQGLRKGVLERWTKGFNCSNTVGMDVVQLLKDALDRRGDIKLDVLAVLNDTTGTLMSCAWKNPNCKIGLIVGTGTNACYVETQRNAENFDDVDHGSGKVIINLEWGAFGDDGTLDFIRTAADRDVDEKSINPGKQLHEKMISGMYMGEMVRFCIEHLCKNGLILGGKGSDLLATRDRFHTRYVSEIEGDAPGTFTNCREILDELELRHATNDDCTNIRFLCECISRRSAHLVSAALATLLNKMDEPVVTVGIDGTVYRLHPHYHNLMMEKMMLLVSPTIKFNIMLSEDGSGRGAALVAAVANKYK